MAESSGRDGAVLSEDSILECISRHFENSHPRLMLGRGDDCAIFKSGSSLCVSSDLFLEEAHFRRSYFTPWEIGYKSLAVNVSDIAGCGAKPVAFTLCLGLPDWVDMPWLEEFFAGMSSLAGRQRMVLAGGDLSRSASLHVSITIFGENLDNCGFLIRGGSMPGDCIFMAGQIGLARIGLAELEKHGRSALERWPAACAAHLKPEPQVGAGLMLARAGFNSRPPALMDISDGIARDLPRLLGQNGELGSHSTTLGAELEIPLNLLHAEVIAHAHAHGLDPVQEAVAGGEDYALLGSCAPDLLAPLQTAIPQLRKIGTVTDSGRICCNGVELKEKAGFDHFEE